MTSKWLTATLCIIAVTLCAASPAGAVSIDVLWYVGDTDTTYMTGLATLAATAHTYAPGSGLTWNLTTFGVSSAQAMRSSVKKPPPVPFIHTPYGPHQLLWP